MKTKKRFSALTIIAIFMVGLVQNFGGCSKGIDPISPKIGESNHQVATLAKSNNANDRSNKTAATSSEMTILANSDSILSDTSISALILGDYPQSGSKVYAYLNRWKSYQGGFFKIANGSEFIVNYGAIIPPAGAVIGADITITMTVEKDEMRNELIFTFGPSGCAFDPPAKVKFDWSDLGTTLANLYYINDAGQYILQTSDEIDLNGRWMTLYISHFSRYALAHSE